jgi:hypothetical protein
MRQVITALTVLFAITAAGVCVLWLLGSLSAWRQIPYNSLLDSLFEYLLIAAGTGVVYRLARVYVAVSPFKSEMWRTWCYLRWVLLSVVVTWIFASGAPHGNEIGRTVTFLKGYAGLLIVGLLGTYAGVKEAALKREMKQ